MSTMELMRSGCGDGSAKIIISYNFMIIGH